MTKTKKRRQPKPVRLPRIVNQLNRFATIEHMVNQLETGELTEVNGTLAYYDFEEGGYFALVPALAGWIVYVSNLMESCRVGRKAYAQPKEDLSSEAVTAHKTLYYALKNDILIESSLIAEVKAEIAQHKQAYLRLTPDEARNVAIKTRIMIQQHNNEEGTE